MRRTTTENRSPARNDPTRRPEQHAAIHRHFSTAKRTITENPLVATLAVFGAGLAVGSVVGSLLADTGYGRHPPTLSERIQRRVSSVLSEMIPNSLEQ